MSLMLPKNILLRPMRISRRNPLGKIQPLRKILGKARKKHPKSINLRKKA